MLSTALILAASFIAVLVGLGLIVTSHRTSTRFRCRNCGYDLRGSLDSVVCSECGCNLDGTTARAPGEVIVSQWRFVAGMLLVIAGFLMIAVLCPEFFMRVF